MDAIDDGTSDAFCMSKALAQKACMGLSDCNSIDMHNSLDRVFFNSKTTAADCGFTKNGQAISGSNKAVTAAQFKAATAADASYTIMRKPLPTKSPNAAVLS